jgi:hypothetical protein
MRGPLPACRNEEPCEAPARGVVLQFTRAGKSVRVRTTQKGTYRVMLQPATYAVTTVPRSRIGTGLTPHSVRVSRGRIARRDFHLDTGLQ